MHLATGQLMLCLQMLKWFMVGDNTCALAVNVMAPFLNGDNNGHQFTFMGGVIGGCTGQFLAALCHRLQSLASILLYNTPNASLRCISVNYKVTPQVRHEQHRCSAQCLHQGIKCSLLSGTPDPLHLGTQQVSERSCNFRVVLSKSFIEVAAAQEAAQLADFSRWIQLHDGFHLSWVR